MKKALIIISLFTFLLNDMGNLRAQGIGEVGIATDSLASDRFLKTVNSGQPVLDYDWTEKGSIGIINSVTFWTDLPKEIGATAEADNLLAGLTFGLGRGLIVSAARGMSGVYDMATFGIPPYNKPAMKPAYTVKKPENGLKIKLLEW